MATKKAAKKEKPADPKAATAERIAAAKTVLAKHETKAGNDPKRRLALKKLKRAQRQLGEIQKAEKREAERKAKKTAAEAPAS